MFKLLLAFLLGGSLTAAIYYFLSSCRISFHNIGTQSDTPNVSTLFFQTIPILIGIIGIIVAIIVGYCQIKSGLDESANLQKSEWLSNIQDRVSSLRALRDELQYDLTVYEKDLLPNQSTYISGSSFHHLEYSTRTIDFNLENNAFEYNRVLLNRVMRFYDFLDGANRVFRQARLPVISIQERGGLYSLIFSQHQENLVEWRKLIQDLGEYSNSYEPIASKASINSLQALTYGTKLVAAIVPNKNKLSIMNVGGEAAVDVKIRCEFSELPEINKKFLIAFLSVRQPVEYGLDPPSYSDRDFQGRCKITYKSEHSDGYKKASFDIRWGASAQKWAQVSGQEMIKGSVLSTSLGSIYDIAPYTSSELPPADLVVELDNNGKTLKIRNKGGSPTSKIQVINEFGQIEGWHDATPQYMLEPGEEMAISMPPQNRVDASFGGKILFQSEGSDEISYKILNFKWDHSLKRWRNGPH